MLHFTSEWRKHDGASAVLWVWRRSHGWLAWLCLTVMHLKTCLPDLLVSNFSLPLSSQLECAKASVISVIWSLRGCEKYGKQQNWFNTPRWSISVTRFVIHCMLLLLSILSEVCRVFEWLNDFMLQLLGVYVRKTIMINLPSLWRHKQTIQPFQSAGLRRDGSVRWSHCYERSSLMEREGYSKLTPWCIRSGK